jgi:hypothetical protein
LKGTWPVTVNGAQLGAGVTTFGAAAGPCITSVTDLTGNPAGIIPALPAAPATGCTIDWYNASTGGSTVTGGYGTASFAPSLTATTVYYAQSRNTTTTCISASRLPVAGTVIATPAAPTLTQNGPTCEGTGVTFTASGGSGTYYWSGDLVVGSAGSAQVSGTTSGTYGARVYNCAVGAITCFSQPSASVVGVVNAYGAKGEETPSCGCRPGLCDGSGYCRSNCPTRATVCDADWNQAWYTIERSQTPVKSVLAYAQYMCGDFQPTPITFYYTRERGLDSGHPEFDTIYVFCCP